jgi:Mrp family chromosome partitioning ATPase
VLLVDATPAAGWDSAPGLVEAAASGMLDAAIRPLAEGVDTARLVGSSVLQPDLLRRSGLAPTWDAVRSRYRLAVIDAPALESGIEGVAIGAQVDSVVVVVEAERTRTQVVERLVDLLRRAQAPVTGTILNKRRFYLPACIYDRC